MACKWVACNIICVPLWGHKGNLFSQPKSCLHVNNILQVSFSIGPRRPKRPVRDLKSSFKFLSNGITQLCIILISSRSTGVSLIFMTRSTPRKFCFSFIREANLKVHSELSPLKVLTYVSDEKLLLEALIKKIKQPTELCGICLTNSAFTEILKLYRSKSHASPNTNSKCLLLINAVKTNIDSYKARKSKQCSVVVPTFCLLWVYPLSI